MPVPLHFEMVSGPDLGGGHLHQLSLDELADGTTRVIFHAQAGGVDAGGPPLGDPAPLGYAQVTEYCPLGGPRCFHREFELGLADMPRARAAYNRMRFVFATMLAQVHGAGPAPPESALHEALSAVAHALGSTAIPWMVGGGASLYLRGLRRAPTDLDLGTTTAGVERIAAALNAYLIEPAARTDWGGQRRLAARAFVGTFVEGLRVECAAPLARPESPVDREWWLEAPDSPPRPVSWQGLQVPLSPVVYALVRRLRRGDRETVDQILDSPLVREISPSTFDELAQAAGVADAEVRRVRGRLEGGRGRA